MRSHAAVAACLNPGADGAPSFGLVNAIVADCETAPIAEKERMLYRAVGAMAAQRDELSPELYAGLLAAGWTEPELYEASTVCALFCFYNAWVDAAGDDSDLPAEYFEQSGRRMAQHGYM
jgi:hypothetical protein